MKVLFIDSRAWIVVLGLGLAAGCGGSVGGGGTGASAGTGGTSSGGTGGATTGGTGGTGGASTGGTGGASTGGTGGSKIKGHTCGNGAPCSAGAKCSMDGIESGVSCDCDATGHFFCEPYAGGGAPPWLPCTADTACGGQGGAGGAGGSGSCSDSNGWCTRTCQCKGTCTDKCDGMGPPQGYQGGVCDESYCGGPEVAFASCSVSDGACNYKVSCQNMSVQVEGNCP
jgi:hypothetical protein